MCAQSTGSCIQPGLQAPAHAAAAATRHGGCHLSALHLAQPELMQRRRARLGSWCGVLFDADLHQQVHSSAVCRWAARRQCSSSCWRTATSMAPASPSQVRTEVELGSVRLCAHRRCRWCCVLLDTVCWLRQRQEHGVMAVCRQGQRALRCRQDAGGEHRGVQAAHGGPGRDPAQEQPHQAQRAHTDPVRQPGA